MGAASGDYAKLGYFHVRNLVPVEVARALMSAIKQDLGPAPFEKHHLAQNAVLRRPAFHVYGHAYRPLVFFLYGLAPVISDLVSRELLPSYDFFRIYREGDICRVHSDRPACEHSVSLTLDYSDGEAWDFQVAHDRTPRMQPVTDDFGADDHSSIEMQVGDAVIYQGVHHRHGRITPNPNAWSAHLFLHFVERGGPFEDHAFDNKVDLTPVNFSFC
jgi:hypothetical protein